MNGVCNGTIAVHKGRAWAIGTELTQGTDHSLCPCGGCLASYGGWFSAMSSPQITVRFGEPLITMAQIA